jgi:hypothetical protein
MQSSLVIVSVAGGVQVSPLLTRESVFEVQQLEGASTR